MSEGRVWGYSNAANNSLCTGTTLCNHVRLLMLFVERVVLKARFGTQGRARKTATDPAPNAASPKQKRQCSEFNYELRDTAHADLYLFEANHRSDKASRSLSKRWNGVLPTLGNCVLSYTILYSFAKRIISLFAQHYQP